MSSFWSTKSTVLVTLVITTANLFWKEVFIHLNGTCWVLLCPQGLDIWGRSLSMEGEGWVMPWISITRYTHGLTPWRNKSRTWCLLHRVFCSQYPVWNLNVPVFVSVRPSFFVAGSGKQTHKQPIRQNGGEFCRGKEGDEIGAYTYPDVYSSPAGLVLCLHLSGYWGAFGYEKG